MKFTRLLTAALCLVQVLWFSSNSMAQCTQLSTLNWSPAPNRCDNAPSRGNIVPLFGQCRTVCMDNTGAGPSNQVADHRCTGGVQPANDLYLYANNPYAQIPGYDGSLVFRWVNWPGKANGVMPPYFAVHGEVQASLGILGTVQSINCTDGFALENAICLDTVEGNQFYAGPGTIPTLQQLTPIVRQIAGVNVDVDDVSFWINIATVNGATGPICFEASAYKTGFLCGDATTINMSGTGSTRTGSSPSTCLCSSALYGGMASTANNLPVPCGVESPSSAWYKVVAPFGCNSISASIPNWGGTDGYNISILSGVSCPGNPGTNPITGAATFAPGQTLQPGYAVVASACAGTATTQCNPVPGGEYYIVVSGKTERPTFSLNVTINDVAPTIGTAASPQNNTNVCSGAPVTVGTTGSVLPLSGSCGQNIAWFYGTSLTFNPYTNGGTYAGSGTSNVAVTLPANTTCSPKTYYIKGVISDNGTTGVAGCKATTNTITVTVYPEIGNVTIQNNPCLISVATRCSGFTVNGNPGVDNFVANFADDGITQNFIVSNGLAGCNQVIQQVVSCNGNCTQPAATAVSACDANDPYNFYVDVTFAPGSAATYFINDNTGGTRAVSTAGTYRVGPFSNGTSVSLSVDNPDDANCNKPLGTFTKDCNTIVCPSLLTATTTITGNVCSGAQTIMQAFVDQGTVNVDYSIQWYRNGISIPGATSPSMIHTFDADQGCSAEAQEFSVTIKCLRTGGSPAAVSSLVAGTLVVYPKPELGVDFAPSPVNCVTAPVDLCGGLTLSHTPVNNPSPSGSPTTVSYTASVAGAPAGCTSTGTYLINCPTCTNIAGNGVQPTDNIFCAGETFNITSANPSIGSGYSQVWAVSTTPPYANLNGAVTTAIAANSYFADPTAAGNFTFTNGTDYGPGEFYFTPFVAMNAINAAVPAYTTTGTINLPSNFLGSSASATITIPQLAYCSGVTSFSMTLTASKSGSSLNPIDNVTGLMTYPGPNTPTLNLATNNYTGNPSGQTITINASAGNFLSATITYTYTLRYQTSIPFPTICPSCSDVGTTVAVNLLPAINLTPVTPSPICIGSVVDLTTYNPAANAQGTFAWYDGDPNTGGQLIARPDSVLPANGSEYFVVFSSLADSTCGGLSSIVFSTVTPPSLNAIPAQPDVCLGETVDLTTLEAGITTSAGSIVWYKGDPDNFGVRLPNLFATNLAPIDQQLYYAVFTDALTGCTNKTSVSYNVKPLPALTGVPPRSICVGDTFDLLSLEAGITAAAGTFEWYAGDPANGGVLLTAQQAAAITPDSGDVFVLVFTDAATTCSAKANVAFNVNPLPALVVPAPAAVCSGTVVDLTLLQSGITSLPGTFTWYVGNPASGGIVLSQPQTEAYVLTSPTTFYIDFTNIITGCGNSTSFTYGVSASPVLNPLAPQVICAGETVDLTALQPSITTATGFFTWYNGDPANGGVQLTALQAAAQTPTGAETYYLEFLAFPSNCSGSLSFSYTVNPLPVINTPANPGLLCAGETVSLTSLQPSVTAANGTFNWYMGNPASGGTAVTGAALTSLAPANNAAYFVVFADAATGCTATESVTFNVAAALGGIQANYDCVLNQLVIDLSNASGGSGGGYIVSGNSPNTNGEVLNNGAIWTVYVNDSIGCADTIIGSVSCLTCDAGTGTALANNVLCCSDMVNVTATGIALGNNTSIAWALTSQTSGAVTNLAGAQAANAAGNLWLSNPANNSLDFNYNCSNVTAGEYLLTPLIVQSPVIDSVVYDEGAGCHPIIEICPTVSGTDWALDPMILVFPDGTIYNVNDSLALGLPLTPGLLQIVGGLPCIRLDSLFMGNPNGTWTVNITNTGTGAVTFTVPAFDIIVPDAACTLISGGNQVTHIDTVAGTIAAGANQQINITIPPLPSSFPALDPNCTDFGTPVELVLLDAITYDEVSVICVDSVANQYTVKVKGLDGGAPAVIAGEEYVFPTSATYNSGTDEYTMDITIPAFPYSLTVANAINSVGGSSCGIAIALTDACTVGIKEDIQLSDLTIYPNPTNGLFYIDVVLARNTDVDIIVTNMLGGEVKSVSRRMSKGHSVESLDMTDVAVGVYFITIKTEKQTITRRLAKQ